MGLIDSVTSSLFGSAPSTTTIAPEDKIAKPDATETALYEDLGSLNQSSMDYATYLANNRQGLYDTTMQNMQAYPDQLASLNYNGQLNPQMSDQLMQMYQNNIANINDYSTEGVGGLMNQMANRGVINSSATGKGFGDISRNAESLERDAYNDYMSNYMNTYNTQYNNDLQQIQLVNQANMQPYSFLESAYQNAYQDPYNMWSKIRGDRYGLTADTIQTPATAGMLTTMAPALTAGAFDMFGGED